MNAKIQKTPTDAASGRSLKPALDDQPEARRPDARRLSTIQVTATGLGSFSAGIRRLATAALVVLATALLCGCQFLNYTGPNGDRFSRLAFGARTAVARLAIETGTNGVRRVELRGYQSDSTETLGAVTEAAVRAAIGGAK